MTDLTQKFDALEGQLATQHAALLAALENTNAMLAALLAAQGVPPPTATATLADVIAAIQAQTIVLEDVHADTISIDQKMLVVRDTLEDVHADTISIDQKLLALRDTTLNIYDVLTVPNSFIAQIRAALGSPTGDATTTVLGYLASITNSNTWAANVLGSPNNSMGTIQSLLSEMAECACNDPLAIPSLEDCIQPFKSTGMGILPAGIIPGAESLVLAVFSEPLPAGVTFGSVFGLSTNNSELHNDDWTGWRMFVKSSGPQFALNPLGLERYPTNTWVPIPANGAPSQGTGNIAFSVSDRDSITVALCSPGVVIVTDPVCEVYTVPWNSANPNSIVVPTIAGRTYRVTLLSADNTVVVFGWVDQNGAQQSVFPDQGIPYTVVTNDTTGLYAQYGYAGAGHAPQLEVCLMPVTQGG